MPAPPTALSPQISDAGILRGNVPWMLWQGQYGPGYDANGFWWLWETRGSADGTLLAPDGKPSAPWGGVKDVFGEPAALQDGYLFQAVGEPGSGGGFFEALADAISSYVLPAATLILAVAAPGVGTLVAGAIAAMQKMAHGASITAALVTQAEAQIPSVTSSVQFKDGFNLAADAVGAAGNTAIEKARQAVEHIAGADDSSDLLKSWRQGVALGRAKQIQDLAIPEIIAAIPHQEDFPGGPGNVVNVFNTAMKNGAALLDATYGIMVATRTSPESRSDFESIVVPTLGDARVLVDKAVSDATVTVTGVRPNPFASFVRATGGPIVSAGSAIAQKPTTTSSSGAKVALVLAALAAVGGGAFLYYRHGRKRRNPRRRRRYALAA